MKKKCNWLYLIALILTFSLGGYVITIICWFIFTIFNKEKHSNKNIFRGFFFVIIILLCTSFVKNYWNGGNNLVNNKIIERLSYDDDKGISGNNRQNEVSKQVWYKFIQSGELYSGLGHLGYQQAYKGAAFDASSAYEFIIDYGLAFTIFIWLSVAIFAFSNRKLTFSLPAYTLLFMDFLQHGYNLETSAFILVFLWLSTKTQQSNPHIFHQLSIKKYNQ